MSFFTDSSMKKGKKKVFQSFPLFNNMNTVPFKVFVVVVGSFWLLFLFFFSFSLCFFISSEIYILELKNIYKHKSNWKMSLKCKQEKFMCSYMVKHNHNSHSYICYNTPSLQVTCYSRTMANVAKVCTSSVQLSCKKRDSEERLLFKKDFKFTQFWHKSNLYYNYDN